MKTIEVCIGSACHLKGSYDVINEFKKLIEERNLEDIVMLKGAFCLGHCTESVAMKIDGEFSSISKHEVLPLINKIESEIRNGNN